MTTSSTPEPTTAVVSSSANNPSITTSSSPQPTTSGSSNSASGSGGLSAGDIAGIASAAIAAVALIVTIWAKVWPLHFKNFIIALFCGWPCCYSQNETQSNTMYHV